ERAAQGEPWCHAANAVHFLPGDDGTLRMPDYRFLVVRPGEPFSPPPAILALHFGEPSEKIAVNGGQIWLYDSLRVPPLERFLRSRIAHPLPPLRPPLRPLEPA